MRVLLLLYGLPCSGKTTVASRLVHHYDFVYLDIESIWHSTFGQPDFTETQSAAVFETLIQAIRDAAALNKNILLEGVFASPDRLSTLSQVCRNEGLAFVAVLLQVDWAVLRKRMRSRAAAGGRLTIERVKWLSAKFSTDQLSSLTIDTTNTEPRLVFNRIVHFLSHNLSLSLPPKT
ncbi:MAG: ATP-binding protein [Candidatus Hydrogenedentes bacterium]|nr:ATP-binding protein [Candidatus Hydrogenedentota bacterium]